MSVQRWAIVTDWSVGEQWPEPEGLGRWVEYTDHERIVAEMEQAHAAALAEAADRQRARDYVSLWSRLMLEDRKYRAALARAAIVIRQRLTDDDVFRLTGQHVRLHEWETVKPLPADKAAAPRTLTADDVGYHSQRCLHCDHIRAAHALTASGCLGHSTPGRPGADCPCSEFTEQAPDA